MKIFFLALLSAAAVQATNPPPPCILLTSQQEFSGQLQKCGVCAYVDTDSNFKVKKGNCNGNGMVVYESGCTCAKDNAFNIIHMGGDGNLLQKNNNNEKVWKSDQTSSTNVKYALVISGDLHTLSVNVITNNHQITNNVLWTENNGKCMKNNFNYCMNNNNDNNDNNNNDNDPGQTECNDEDVDEIILVSNTSPITEVTTDNTCVKVEPCGEIKFINGNCNGNDVIYESNCEKNPSRGLRSLTNCDYNCKFTLQGDANLIVKCHDWDYTLWKSDKTHNNPNNYDFALVRSGRNFQVMKWQANNSCNKFNVKFIMTVWDLDADGGWCRH